MKVLLLIVSGALGTLARYWLGGVISRLGGAGFPYGTLAVNSLGCFLIGIFSVMAQKKFMLGPQARTFLMIGFCGAFTTFSTFILESANLAHNGEAVKALANVGAGVVIGFAAFWSGTVLADIL